jgi:hypothetical protein
MNGVPGQRALNFLFWLWIIVILGLYVGSFGPVIRLLLSWLLP